MAIVVKGIASRLRWGLPRANRLPRLVTFTAMLAMASPSIS